jgi:2-dehydro-3-deoxyphosphogalactonate aldolase
MDDTLARALQTLPLVAILRGIAPQQAVAVAQSLYDSGFRVLEVPLNSPQPLASIEAMRRALPGDALVGAGTVLDVAAVSAVRDAGGQLVVMPHADTAVITAAKAAGLHCMPGIATPTEAFAALAAGADALKLFPAEALPPAALKAMKAVLPAGTRLLPVGGITPPAMAPYVAAGAAGFGLGSALFTTAMAPDVVRARALAFLDAWRALRA